jgi:hypothetical protein
MVEMIAPLAAATKEQQRKYHLPVLHRGFLPHFCCITNGAQVKLSNMFSFHPSLKFTSSHSCGSPMTPSSSMLQLHSYPAEVMIAGRAVWVLAFARISAVRAMLVAARRYLGGCYNQLLSPM